MKKTEAEANVKSKETQKKGEQELDDFRFIKIRLTYPGYPTFVFSFLRAQSKELLDLKDRFYDLSEQEQREQTFNQRLTVLSKLLTIHPNIPGWNTKITPEESFFEYFLNDEQTIGWIWNIYQDKLYPKEVIGNTLE